MNLDDLSTTYPHIINNKTEMKAVGDTQMAAFDRKIQYDWHRFIRGGFEYEDLSDGLFGYLALYSGFETIKAYQDRRDFWGYYFASDTCRLQRFWAYFAGQTENDQPGEPWLETGLGRLLAADLAAILPTLQRTLAGLYETMYQAEKWHVLIEKQAYLRHSPERLIHWSRRYDEDHRFPAYEAWLAITPEVRRFLRLAAQAACHRDVNRPVLLFETIRHKLAQPIYAYQPGVVAQVEVKATRLVAPRRRQRINRAQRSPTLAKKGRRHVAQD
jgi:hypothetical protein